MQLKNIVDGVNKLQSMDLRPKRQRTGDRFRVQLYVLPSFLVNYEFGASPNEGSAPDEYPGRELTCEERDQPQWETHHRKCRGRLMANLVAVLRFRDDRPTNH
jgi:hypothetical protein